MKYRFKFDKFPALLKEYEHYKKLRMCVVKYSMKNSQSAGDKLEQAIAERKAFARTVLAQSIYNAFTPIKPRLHHCRKDVYEDWDSRYGKPFDELEDKLRDELVGLLDGDFIYELPIEYYNY